MLRNYQAAASRVQAHKLFSSLKFVRYFSGNVNQSGRVHLVQGFLKCATRDEDYPFRLVNVKDGNLVDLKALNRLNAEKILSHCVPSTYGDVTSKVDKIDSAVRNAMECPGCDLRITSEDSKIAFEDPIKTFIADELLGDSHETVQLLLNKLSVYSAGGHFVSHTDRDDDIDKNAYVGTLVVCLPSAHKGGDLVVKHESTSTVVDFATYSGDPSKIQFAAFRGAECPHEVQEVTSGHRIVLSYVILKTGRLPVTTPAKVTFVSKTYDTGLFTRKGVIVDEPFPRDKQHDDLSVNKVYEMPPLSKFQGDRLVDGSYRGRRLPEAVNSLSAIKTLINNEISQPLSPPPVDVSTEKKKSQEFIIRPPLGDSSGLCDGVFRGYLEKNYEIKKE